jgi:hypothetical protein
MSEVTQQKPGELVSSGDGPRAKALYSSAGLVLSGLLVLLVWYYDWAVLGSEIIPKTGPDFSGYGIAKTMAMAGLSASVIASIYFLGNSPRGMPRAPAVPPLGIAAAHAALCGIVTLYLVDPAAFHRHSLEDSVVEYASALLLLLAAFLYLRVFVSAWRHRARSAARLRAIALAPLCAFAVFVIGMEELSWMQRIFRIETPEAFSGNGQGETNFHNYYTRSSHALYVMGAWGCLIFLPFYLGFGPRLRILDRLHGFLPDRSIAALSAPLAGLFYPSWGFMAYQMIFFTSVLIMLIFARHAWRGGLVGEAALFGAGAAGLVAAQGLVLLTENRFGRIWDVSEYQEGFIALGLAALAWSTRRQWRDILAPGGRAHSRAT